MLGHKIRIVAITTFLLLRSLSFGLSYGNYEYSVSNNEVTITDYSGDDTSITIPAEIDSKQVIHIGQRAFSQCSKLTSVIIPDSITSIEYRAFYKCESLTSVKIGDGVRFIADNSFESCSNLESVEIGNSVVSIGEKAFYNCRDLLYLVIPDSVVSIGKEAFYNCILFSIVIGDSVEVVGSNAFNCDILRFLTIGSSLKSLDNIPIHHWDLMKIDVNQNNKHFSSLNGVLFNKSLTTIIRYPRNKQGNEYTIPDSVISIGDYAFWDCDDDLKSVGIGNNVTSIGKQSFYSCSLKSLVIGDSVTYIGEKAFYKCESLTSVTIGRSLNSLDNLPIYETRLSAIEVNPNNEIFSSLEGVLFSKDLKKIIKYPNAKRGEYRISDSTIFIENRAFWDCTYLTSVTISDNVESIGSWAFQGCNSLTFITIPDSVVSIGQGSFARCDSLIYVDVGDSVTSIGENAFQLCISLNSVIIGDSVTSVGLNAFSGCNELNTIKIGRDLETLDNIPTLKCPINRHKLKSIEVSQNNKIFASLDGVLFNKNFTSIIVYPYLKEGTAYVIPDSVISIEENAFCECNLLKSVVIPNSVTTIGNYAFDNCYALISLDIGHNIESIGKGAFKGCRSLTSLIIPDRVTFIDDYAFKYCTSLRTVVFGDSVTSIGNEAFYHCNALISVSIGSKLNSLVNLPIYGGVLTSVEVSPNNETFLSLDGILFSKDLTTIYKYPVEKKGDEYNIPESVSLIGERAFAGCVFLTSITIPESVTVIENSAFGWCDLLTSVILPENLISIGDYAFYDCDYLKSIIIPNSVIFIGNYAFAGCDNANSLVIGDGLESISWYAFLCRKITSITIGNKLKSLDNLPLEGSLLTKIEVSPDNNFFTSLDGVLLNKELSCIIKYPRSKMEAEFVFPNTVTSIRRDAIDGCANLVSLVVPDGITSIGYNVFNNCSSLESIYVYPSPHCFFISTPIVISDYELLLQQKELSNDFVAIIESAVSTNVNIQQLEVKPNVIKLVSEDNEILSETTEFLLEGNLYTFSLSGINSSNGFYFLEIDYNIRNNLRKDLIPVEVWQSSSLNNDLLHYVTKYSDVDGSATVIWEDHINQNIEVIEEESGNSPYFINRRFMKVPSSIDEDSSILVNISLHLKEGLELPSALIINENLPSGCSLITNDTELAVRGDELVRVEKVSANYVSWFFDEPKEFMSYDYKVSQPSVAWDTLKFSGSLETVDSKQMIRSSDEVHTDGTREWNMVLNKGWNLVSVPFAIDIGFDALYDFVPQVWTWNNRDGFYEFARTSDKIAVGQGFWVYSNSDQSININGENIADSSITTHIGWNLIGPIKDCDFGFGLFEFVNNHYEEVNNAEPGKGYWHFQLESELVTPL